MKRILLEGPVAEPVTLAEAKAHLRIDGDDEDDLIGALTVAARVATETEIRRVMIAQSWRAFVEVWPEEGIELPVQPALSVEAVRAIDTESMATLLDAEDHAFDIADGSVELKNPLVGTDHYEIDFLAGYGASSADVPQPLRQAILMLAAHWHEHRSAVSDGERAAATPLGYRELIQPYRKVALC
ncbi:MAG: head-tail connector protein [Propylenella sp.]